VANGGLLQPPLLPLLPQRPRAAPRGVADVGAGA
jgi:hypothetical protein